MIISILFFSKSLFDVLRDQIYHKEVHIILQFKKYTTDSPRITKYLREKNQDNKIILDKIHH